MSPEHSSAPEPPVAGCSPATASARPVSTLQAMCWSSSVPCALRVITAASGCERYRSLSGAWRVRRAAASISFLSQSISCHPGTTAALLASPPQRGGFAAALLVGGDGFQRVVEGRKHAAGGGLEGRRELVAGPRQAKRLLVEDAAGLRLHDDGAVGKRHRLLDVVGNEEHRRAVLLPQGEKMLVQARPGEGVEGRERLVEEEHLRLGHEGAGDRDPLLLAAGQLARPAAGMLDEPDAGKRVPDPVAALGGGAVVEPEADIVGDGQPGQEARLLEHDPDRRVRLAQALAVEENGAAGGPVESGDEAQG